jgi:dTMP kinase
MNPRTETQFFGAAVPDRWEVNRPKLEEGLIVILDRYADSTIAYSGYGHGNDLTWSAIFLDLQPADSNLIWPSC